MPCYFFTVIYSDQAQIWDRKGTQLRDDATAIEVARRVFDDFRVNLRPEDPQPTIIVKNEACEIVYRYPANWGPGDGVTSPLSAALDSRRTCRHLATLIGLVMSVCVTKVTDRVRYRGHIGLCR